MSPVLLNVIVLCAAVTPVTIEVREGGTRIVTAIRSDGAQVTARGPAAWPFNTRSITTGDKQQNIVVVDKLKVKSTFYFHRNPELVAGTRPENPKCTFSPRQDFLGEETIAGHHTFKYNAPGTMSITSWRAPGLNCLPIQETIAWKSADGTVTVQHRLPELIQVGEPDASLFAVPEDYREVPPSEFERGSAGARFDQKYYDSQKHKP